MNMVKSVSTALKVFSAQAIIEVFNYSPGNWRKSTIWMAASEEPGSVQPLSAKLNGHVGYYFEIWIKDCS